MRGGGPYWDQLRGRLEHWRKIGLREGTAAWRLLMFGLELPVGYSERPPEEVPAYRLTVEERTFWAEEAPRLIGLGVLRAARVGEEVYCSPAFFVPKKGKRAYRLVVDMREINKLLPPIPCVLPRLIPFLRFIAGLEWVGEGHLLVLDISDAFYCIGVGGEAQALLGVGVEGSPPFVYTGLPMGLCWSPGKLMTLQRVVRDHFRRRGVPCIVYLDDWLLLVKDHSEAVSIQRELEDLGFAFDHPSRGAP